MDNKNNKFKYTYSAPTKSEREQIEDIRKNYLPKSDKEAKMERLKKLDEKVKNIPTIYGLCIGIVGLLIFGLGITMILEWKIVVWGIIISIIGLIPMCLAYPIFSRIKNKLTDKYKKEILDLSEELLNENE